MAEPTFDETEWPLLQITMTPAMDGPEREAFYARLHAYYSRGVSFVVLADMRAVTVRSALQRKRAAGAIESDASLMKKTLAAAAIVLETPLQRGILTAVLWIATPPLPVEICATLAEGRRWLGERLSLPVRAGGKPPAA